MKLNQVEEVINDHISRGRPLKEIIDFLASNKCNHNYLRLAFLKRKLLKNEEIQRELESHPFYSEEIKKENPFTEAFIKSFNQKE